MVPTTCKCSLLQAEIERLNGLVLKCLADQKKLQQETAHLSAQLQSLSRMDGTKPVRVPSEETGRLYVRC